MAKSGSGLFHNSTSGHTVNKDRGSSAAQHTSVGSGSRPVRSVHGTDHAAADDPHTQGRAPKGKDAAVLK
jgi:hypothetical protein